MLTRHSLLIAGAAALGITLAVPAAAQDVEAEPSYGDTRLRAGFSPDPYEVELQAGGAIDAAVAIGEDCRGTIANAPDFNLTYRSGNGPLHFGVTSASDTTLIINTPDGEWHCNDDSGGNFNPALSFETAEQGLYNIWVGTYSPTTNLPNATLIISEVQATSAPAAKLASGIDLSLAPNFGEVALAAGFEDDPRIVEIVAGGEVNAEFIDGSCRGWVSRAPDYRVNYSDPDGFDLTFSAVSNTDITMVVSGPDGTIHCDDDSYGDLNPQVTVAGAAAGAYSIWLGTYGQGERFPDALLGISEIGEGPDMGALGGSVDWTLDPNFGSAQLATGFLPDPHMVEIVAGGEEDAGLIGSTCTGYVAVAPDYNLDFASGALPLTFSVTSESDTTLVVRAPDGTFHCNDDSGGSLNPRVSFSQPQSGTYNVWVGVWGFGADYGDATLSITELDTAGGTAGGVIDVDGEPSYGEAALESGFSPDPYVVSLNAGGSEDAGQLGFACAGYVAAYPDFILDYRAGELPLYISASSSVDTTLAIYGPDGQWYCADDYFGLSPAVEFDDPDSGEYRIWVGTYLNTEDLPPATLYVSEVEPQF